MTDLQAKYQRLATEYSKIRAQIPVLKKAVIDEKSIQDKLKDELKEKEQAVRKCSQEIDSLSFRNQQLSKRVLFLQDELDMVKGSKKKHKNKEDHPDPAHVVSANNVFTRSYRNKEDHPDPPHVVSANNVFTEELQSKIEENARLHKAIADVGGEYETRIRELESSVEKYESETSTHQQTLDATVATNKAQVDRLLEDKVALEVRLQNVEGEIKDANHRAQLAESNLKSVTGSLQTKLDQSQRIVYTNLPFIDNQHKSLNSLNLPTHDRKHQLRVRELMQQCVTMVTDMSSALSNMFTYMEQRSRVYPNDGSSEPMTPVNVKLCQLLHEHMTYTKPVEKALQHFLHSLREDHLTILDTATDLQPFGATFHRLVQYMDTVLPYMVLSLEEESVISSCPSTLQKKNADLVTSIRRLFSCYNQTESYVSIITSQSKDASKQYNCKVSLEHQLPTATQTLKTTDECIVSALVSLVTSTGKLSAYLTGNADTFTQQAGYRTRGSSCTDDPVRCDPVVTSFRQMAADYLASLYTAPHESVPYKTAIQNRRILLSSSESRDSLAHQLNTVQTQLSDMVQEKERFLLELQLLKIKYEREIQKNQTLESQLDGSGVTYIDSIQANMDYSATRSESIISVAPTTPNDIGTLHTSKSKGDNDVRESLIKGHFSSRINELTAQLQLADSKAVNFHAEVRALHKRLMLSDRGLDTAQEETKAACTSLSQLNDELHTTTKSYEAQLSMMSEHLAGMNDRLAQQQDEIEGLRAQLVTVKSGKKLSGLKK